MSTADDDVDGDDLTINLDGYPHDHPFEFNDGNDDIKEGAAIDLLDEYQIVDKLDANVPYIAEEVDAINSLDI